VIAAVAGVVTLTQRRAAAELPRLSILLGGGVLAWVAYLVTPYSAQGLSGMPTLVAANTRYGAPALLLAAPLLAWQAGRLRPRVASLRWALEAVLLGCTIAELRDHFGSSAGRIVLCAAMLVAVGAGVWAARRLPLPALPGLAAMLVCAGVGLAYHYQRVLARRPYAPADPTVSYVLAHAPAHARIAIAGEWTAQGLIPVAPLFGPRLKNHVTFVGPWIEHRLQDYAAPGPFVRALRAGDYDFLEIGTGFPPRPDPVQASWARAAGFVPVVSSGRLLLMARPRARRV